MTDPMIDDVGAAWEYVGVEVHAGPEHEVRYTAGLMAYHERLVRRHFVGGHRSAAGRPRGTAAFDAALGGMLGALPVDTFDLQVDGYALASHWRWVAARQLDPPPALPGARHAVVELAHEIRPIRVAVHTLLDGTPFLARWLEVTNDGAEPTALTAVAPLSGLLWLAPRWRERLPDAGGRPSPFTVARFAQGSFGHEGDLVCEDVRPGSFVARGRHGHSGWGLPFFIARNEATGEAAVVHLAWSGNWALELTVEDDALSASFYQEGPSPDAALFFRLAADAPAPQRLVAPGETVATPAVHLGYLQADLDGCAQALHAHLRRAVFPPHIPGRTLLVGAGRVVEGDAAWLRREIDTAAAVGCEYFTVDAGWYGAQPGSWSTTVGDWDVGAWLPDGPAGVRERIHGTGMLLGLWMEPESVGGDSALARRHPEWIARRDGTPLAGGRGLDLGDPAAARWAGDEVLRVIGEHAVDLFKLDYNTHLGAGGERVADGRGESTLWCHVEAIYGIIDRVRARYPDVVPENCASGGGRNDIGMAGRFHVCCLSGWASPPRSLRALYNLTVALPPDRLRCYIGHMDDGLHGGDALAFRLQAALFANPLFVGFAPGGDVEDNQDGGGGGGALDPPLLALYRRYIALYKEWARPLLPDCRVFHYTPVAPLAEPAHAPWCALEYAAPAGSRAYAGVFRLAPGGDDTYRLRPRGLDPARDYVVTSVTSGAAFQETGARLVRDGLDIRCAQPLTSDVLLFAGR